MSKCYSTYATGRISGFHKGKIIIKLDVPRSLLRELIFEARDIDDTHLHRLHEMIGANMSIYETNNGFRARFM